MNSSFPDVFVAFSAAEQAAYDELTHYSRDPFFQPNFETVGVQDFGAFGALPTKEKFAMDTGLRCPLESSLYVSIYLWLPVTSQLMKNL